MIYQCAAILIILLFYLFQIPDLVSITLITAYLICLFFDLHSTLRKPSMILKESNPLLCYFHKQNNKLPWFILPTILCEFAILIGMSIILGFVTHDFIYWLPAIAAFAAITHITAYYNNEKVRNLIK